MLKGVDAVLIDQHRRAPYIQQDIVFREGGTRPCDDNAVAECDFYGIAIFDAHIHELLIAAWDDGWIRFSTDMNTVSQ